MSLIRITNLTFGYDGSYDHVFENVSFQIDTDWKLGFTGRNGRGKTTFLNLLLGRLTYQGTITASTAFEYFPFVVADPSRRTLDVLLGIGEQLQTWEIERELSLMSVDLDVLERPFSTLSNGEQTKVLLAALFLKENRFLLIDEPTNHLDREGREAVARYLNTKKGFILVSHDRHFLDSCIDHILTINKASIEVQSGNFSSWYQNKQWQDQYEAERNAQLKKDIRKLEIAARRTADWSDRIEASKIGEHAADRGWIGHQAARMMKRSKVIEQRKDRQIDEKASLLKNIDRTFGLKVAPLDYPARKLAELERVSVRYGERVVCENVSFQIERGDRIALRGKNGSGKSSLIKLICGEDIPHEGRFSRGSALKISYVQQDAGSLSGDLKEYVRAHGVDESLFKAILNKLDFAASQFDKDLSDYSAGQKKKVLLARSLCEQAHLYIWDEPLNYVDILSRIQIEDLLLDSKPTILFVEHDAAFCDRIATKTVLLD